MPLPGEIVDDTLFDANTGFARAQAAGGPVAATAAPVIPEAAPAASAAPATPAGWPEGLGPAGGDRSGLPAHLTTATPPPAAADPNAGIPLDATGAPIQVDQAQLAEIHARIAGGPAPTPATPAPTPQVQLSTQPAPTPEPQQADESHMAAIYQLSLSQEGLRPGKSKDGLIWKIACKTGMLALSPGPGQIAVDKPLVLTKDLFDGMVLSLKEKAFPYTTVPETHANGSLENTGYVDDAAVLSKAEALLDQRVTETAREIIEKDPDDTHYLLAGIRFTDAKAKQKAEEGSIPDVSIGVKFDWRNTRTGKLFKYAWNHLALTPEPWIDGLPAFGLSATPGAVYDQAADRERFDGVYLEPSDEQREQLNAAMSIRQREGTNYDSAKAQAAINALAPGDEWSFDYGVRVQAMEVADGEKDTKTSAYMLNCGYDSPMGDVPVLFTNVEKLMPAVDAAVLGQIQRREAQRLRDQIASAVAPVAAAYSITPPKNEPAQSEGDTLPEGDGNDTVRLELSANSDQEEQHATMPTAEEILAQQQAEIEALKSQLAETQANLSLSQGAQQAAAAQLREEAVAKRIRLAQSQGVAPSLCLAAREILLKDDSPVTTPEGQGLNLSITQGEGDTATTTVLQRPTDIVEYMLSAASTADGDAATKLAALYSGLDTLALSQQPLVEKEPSAEEKTAQVDEWEKENHPERFNPDGTRKAD